jgi:7-cyano-7-deazaguanine reductase
MSDHCPAGSPLGKTVPGAERYDPALLYPLPRAPQRRALGIADTLPFVGADLWTAYELSWLNPRGKPQVAIAQFTLPCESSHLVESKSLKLYLHGYHHTVFASADAVREQLRADLGAAAWHGGTVRAGVGVRLITPERFDAEAIHELDGVDLDRLDVECTHAQPAPELLRAALDEQPVGQTLVSRLFRSVCPVTGQPDWASVQIRYRGPQIEQGGLLRYLVSYRRHAGFHEDCVERIYRDVWTHCQPTRLAVYARFTRRGGLDINPWRSSHPQPAPPAVRTARQ